MQRSWWQSALPWIWITSLTLLAYGLALRNGYVWDDRYFLTDYVWIGSYVDAYRSALRPLFNAASYFRPLPIFSLYAEAIASGRNAAISHGINLVWHASSGALVYLLARRGVTEMSPRSPATVRWLPLLLASAFVVHPALSEAVVWISARFDLMAATAMLLALWLSGLPWRDWTRALAIAACFFIGAMSKESTIALPIALGTYTLLRASAARPDGRVVLSDAFTAREWKCYGAIIAAGFLYLLLRAYAMQGYVTAAVDQSIEERIALWATSITKYLQLTFAPFSGNSIQHHFAWRGSGSLHDHVTAIFIACSTVLLVIGLALRRRPLGWLLLAWFGAYLPVMHIIPLPIGSSVIHQRFMYFPTALLFALLPYVILRIQPSAAAIRAAWIFGSLLVLCSLVVVRSIVPVWKDDLTLWSWTVEKDPSSPLARENLIFAYVGRGMTDEASRELMKIARNRLSTSARVPLNMGVGHFTKGEYKTAMYYYDIAYQNIGTLTQEEGSKLLANMAMASAMQGDREPARSKIHEAVRADHHSFATLGYLLAFCNGLPPLEFVPSAEEIERAQQVAAHAAKQLMEAQPELQDELAFCPYQ